MRGELLDVRPEVAAALRDSRPVVALESTLIAHGLPRPLNLETARLAEDVVRQEGGVPATIAVLRGVPTIGLGAAELQELAEADGVLKASTRDLATAVAKKRTAATTVAATMWLAHRAGIKVFATGGIGGVHRGAAETGDVSADLTELARTPVAVVCAGAKSILDLPRTLEMLETLSVPVVGYETDEFPAFYVRSSGLPLPARVDSPDEAAALLSAHWALGRAGVVLARPLDTLALGWEEFEAALAEAERQAARQGVRGPALTPFLLARLAEITGGRTLRANQALIVANARLAAQVARAL
ncbi:MAG TPA: pseudouridine-5'-phosphate glycosidase [Gemmataceae bacterium]|nr:pseudouridine-5'-phosphate glycosidase [Gemmataceae bacterium]